MSNKKQKTQGKVRVGRIRYENGKPNYPSSVDNYTNIVVMLKSTSKWWPLSPYYVSDDEGRIHENLWQASKVYEKVPKSVQKYSRYDNRIIWEHPAETHVESGQLTEKYWAWREKLMRAKDAIRYPVGFHHRHKCLYALAERGGEPLDYVQGRKQIYFQKYWDLVQKYAEFEELRQRLQRGENLMIIEVDGPHQESLEYYKEKYQVTDDFIENDSILANKENLNIMMNDTLHPFGHGYCLAMVLQNLTVNDLN